MTTAAAREKIIVFDVNETLLDIEVLGPFFEKTFGDARVMRQWFAELILYSEAITLANSYTEFGKLGAAVLDMLAKIHGVCVSEKDSAEFAEAMRRLCPHPEVNEALERLKQAGFRMVAFTNSAPQDGETALDRAGLAHYFECQISVHETRCFKPARKTYDLVATRLGAEPRNLRLVAAHTWDVIGALGADWTAALVTRPGNAPLQTGVQPDIIESELLAVADRIIAIDA